MSQQTVSPVRGVTRPDIGRQGGEKIGGSLLERTTEHNRATGKKDGRASIPFKTDTRPKKKLQFNLPSTVVYSPLHRDLTLSSSLP